MRRAAWIVTTAAVALTGCGIAPASHQLNAAARTPPPSSPATTRQPTAAPASTPASTVAPAVVAAADATAPPRLPHSPGGGPGRFRRTAPGVLDGKVILVDPGHNGGNFDAASVINQLIWNGRESETCDTTGAESDSGYTEAQFNWNVARYLTADLRAAGATVVLTRTSNTGVGPCVTKRAALGNQAHANAAVSIHADGGPPGGRGFAILEPVADGIQPRDDLAGVNLSTVPKVFIECANMRNATDAALITSPAWQAKAARAIAAGLTRFLTRR